MFSRLDTTPACDRLMDGRTHRHRMTAKTARRAGRYWNQSLLPELKDKRQSAIDEMSFIMTFECQETSWRHQYGM